MPPPVADRLSTVPKSTVWHEFTPLAAKHGAINLGQGFPSFAPEDFVKKAAADAIMDANAMNHQYCRPGGHMALVNVLAKKYSAQLNREIDPLTEILVTNGTTHGLYCAFSAFLSEGDEFIIFEPFFDLYIQDIELSGGKPVVIPLRPSTVSANDWTVDLDAVRAAITPRTKGLLLNTPQNVPSKVWAGATELKELAALCVEHDLLVIADEVYERMAFGAEHVSIASLPGMWERTVTLSSAGKTFSVTGWKIGWVVGPPKYVFAMQQTCNFQAFSICTPLQIAVANTMTEAATNGYYERFDAMYARKRDALCASLTAAGLPPVVPQGSFFVLADISAVKPEAFIDPNETEVAKDWQFCRWLTKEIRVTAIPTTAFVTVASRPAMEKFVRFAFCKSDEDIAEAGTRLLRVREFLQ